MATWPHGHLGNYGTTVSKHDETKGSPSPRLKIDMAAKSMTSVAVLHLAVAVVNR